MGHSINAVVGPLDSVARIVEAAGCPPPTSLPFGLVIAPLGHAQIDRLTGCNLGEVAEGFKYLSPSLEEGLSDAARGGAFAYIETQYFGGTGTQAAALFLDRSPPFRRAASDAKASIGPDSPINSALRSLGVRVSSGQDEFEAVNLSRFRDLEALGLDEWGDD